MPRRVQLPDSLRHRAFDVSDPEARPLSAGRLRGPDLVAPFRGVRASAGLLLTFLSLARACATRMPPHAFFSHATAALLHGMPLPARLDPTWRPDTARPDTARPELPLALAHGVSLDVSVPMGMVAATGRGIRSHRIRIDEADIVDVKGLLVTSRERTWCDLAALLSLEELVAAGDFLLWRRHPPKVRLTSADLELAIQTFEGRRGRPALVAALPRLSDHADSPPESVIRMRAVDAGLPAPAVNVDLHDDFGRFLGRPDLSWRGLWTTFDYEGDGHRTDPDQWESDIARVPRLENAGYAHIRGSRADLRDSTQLIGNIALRLRDRGWTPVAGTEVARILRTLGR